MNSLSRKTHDEIDRLAREHGWRLVVLFGSAARVGEARDVDLAVLPAELPDLMQQGRWVSELEPLFAPRPVDLVVLSPNLAPLTRFEVFRAGVPLFEAEAGLMDREQDRAFFLYADSEVFRRAARETLRG